MTPTFLAALRRLEGLEGGIADHPDDRGGRTNRGITQTTYDHWRVTTGKEKRAVDLLEEIELQAIYFEDYWQMCNCEALPEALAYCVFDMAVNSGPWNAKLTLQRALNVRADGVIGPITIAAAKTVPEAALKYLKRRGGYIQEVISGRPSQVVFLGGWTNRLLEQAWRLK